MEIGKSTRQRLTTYLLNIYMIKFSKIFSVSIEIEDNGIETLRFRDREFYSNTIIRENNERRK